MPLSEVVDAPNRALGRRPSRNLKNMSFRAVVDITSGARKMVMRRMVPKDTNQHLMIFGVKSGSWLRGTHQQRWGLRPPTFLGWFHPGARKLLRATKGNAQDHFTGTRRWHEHREQTELSLKGRIELCFSALLILKST